MHELYIGLMSGTSVDGIDAALVDLGGKRPALLATDYEAYPPALRHAILALCEPGENEIERLGQLDALLGQTFANAVNSLLARTDTSPKTIKAIGSHGQTIRHCPHAAHPFTLQIGDPNIIAAETGITTVADFRRKDVALGGQGAPLVPAFHQAIFADEKTNRAIVNIGGIANITLLAKNDTMPVMGFDTGPGNVLLDAWVQTHLEKVLDERGEWASTGKIQPSLLKHLLKDTYFAKLPPKSTGREYFNLNWLNQYLLTEKLYSPADIEATLVELTAKSIIDAIQKTFFDGDIFICGGGARNDFLMSRLAASANSAFTVQTTAICGVDPDWVEAIAFAWFAKQCIHHLPGNLPNVTGARKTAVLGGIYAG